MSDVGPGGPDTPDAYQLRVLGRVRSPLTDPRDAARQGDEGAPDAVLELDPSVEPALAGPRR